MTKCNWCGKIIWRWQVPIRGILREHRQCKREREYREEHLRTLNGVVDSLNTLLIELRKH